MKPHNEIKVETDGKGQGHRYHVIYDRNGKEHHLGQLMDAENAIATGAYTAKPPEQKKVRKKIK
ncbi:MAG: hypothetical protein L6406_14775 [Desulfobacterales bacterium]|nr:hypothetical protein [Desulfobacterales bacterium]